MRKVIKKQLTKLTLFLVLLDTPGRVLWLLRSLFIQRWPPPWLWVGWWEKIWDAQACVSTHKHTLTHISNILAIILDLQKSCKDSTVFPYNLHLACSNINILCDHGTVIQAKKLTFIHTVN